MSCTAGSTAWQASHLTLHVVGHIVRCAACGHFPDRPRGVVGEMRGKDTDTQLSLGRKEGGREKTGEEGTEGIRRTTSRA